MSTNVQVAETIAAQLGGTRRLSVMIGAKHFVALANGLTFQHMRGSQAVTFTRITLAADTYTVEIGKIVRRAPVVVHTVSGVYADVLRDVIERKTGLHLSLGTMGR